MKKIKKKPFYPQIIHKCIKNSQLNFFISANILRK